MSRSSSHAFLRFSRLLHLYLGIFTAPALIFFAFTGALQTFSLHETTRGSSYKPPAWAVTLGQIHKKQTPVVPDRKRPPSLDSPSSQAPGNQAPERRSDPDKRSEGRARATEAAALAQSAAVASKPDAPTGRKHHPLPLKIFFLIVAIGLFLSSLTGIYMSYKYMRNRTMVTALLILGIVIPIALVFV
jgi:hypothetical protein